MSLNLDANEGLGVLFNHNTRSSFGETALGQLHLGADPCFFESED